MISSYIPRHGQGNSRSFAGQRSDNRARLFETQFRRHFVIFACHKANVIDAHFHGCYSGFGVGESVDLYDHTKDNSPLISF
jgi:hypothetical protein